MKGEALRTSAGMPRRASRAYLSFLAIALAYSVLNGGGRTFVDWNVCLLSIGLVALVYWLRTDAADTAPSLDPWLGWAVVLAPSYVALQLVPLPLDLLRILSPAWARILASLERVTQAPTVAPLSVNAAVTFRYLLNIAAYTLVFLLVREITWRSRQRPSWAPAIPLISIAALEAGLGLLQAAGDADTQVQGTYRNKNHFAGLLEMVLPITVAYAVALLHKGKQSRRGAPSLYTLEGCAILGIAGVIFLGLIESLSKMGFVAGLCGLFVMGAMPLTSTLQGAKKWMSMAGLTASCLLAFLFLPTNRLVSNFAQLFSDTTGEGRLPIWRDTLHLFGAYPLFGSGLGSYGTAFVNYQTAVVDFAVTFAHNDYLQLASELGVVGFSLFAGLMLTVLIRAIRAATRGGEWDTRALGLGCTGAIAAIAVHSVADFNMYIPANALLLAWIGGMAVGLPRRSLPDRQIPSRAFFRRGAIVLGCLLVVYAPASILAGTAFRGNLQEERQFCRFGICDTDAVLDVQTEEPGRTAAAAPVAELLEAVQRDPAAPDRWCDLGEAMLREGRVEQAKHCFSNALALGPHIPSILLRAANFYHGVGESKRALAQTSRVLEDTPTYDDVVFNWYREKQMPVTEILGDGLPSGKRASQAFLRYLIYLRNFDDAAIVWSWLLASRTADDRLAHDYMAFLYRDQRYETAARSWALYHADRRNGYLESNRLFNGDFESEPSGAVFDWRMENLNEDVEVAVDANVARSGARSLRIHFGGKANVTYGHTSQTVFVTPGVYGFQAFVRAQGITTDQGVAFHIFDPEGPGRVDVRTEQVVGTNDWRRIKQIVRVPHGTRLLVVQVVRQRSWKFDSHIGGAAWIDDVSLANIE